MTPRVAYFTDCYHEVNGVALTSRQFECFARRRQLPFFNVHAGPLNRMSTEGSVTMLELDSSKISFPLDDGFSFDLLFLRWLDPVREFLLKFKPDLIHVTSMGAFGLLGAVLAEQCRLPLVASWHTNVHQFGAKRLESFCWFLPDRMRKGLRTTAQSSALRIALRFYRRAKLVFAPNRQLIRLLKKGTGRPVVPMWRGVDTHLFDPARRERSDDDLVLGYVGRIRPEKNVRFLAELQQRLLSAGIHNHRFLIVGQGDERDWLEQNLSNAEFPGVLHGEELANAYANMDLFVFPSRTDTFGNVVQEALSSGVPAVVTKHGGPKYLVQHGETGYIAQDSNDFCDRVVQLAGDSTLHRRMSETARRTMLDRSWDSVFEGVYRAYPQCLSVR